MRWLLVQVVMLFMWTPCLHGQVLQDQLLAEGVPSLAKAARTEGDPQRGAIIFHQPYLACAKCHAIGQPATLGPDLTRLGQDATADHLVESVLLPSKLIRKGYETIKVETTDGKVFIGLHVEDAKDRLVLRDPSTGQAVSFPKAKIEHRVAVISSIMPEGQANQLAGRQQFLDLIRYIVEINEGGPARAAQLQPPASLLVLQIPEYEKHIDHAGFIADWSKPNLAAKAHERGAAIYNRLCVNCHGSKDQPGSLPTSPKFAVDKLKNGADPFRMYQTLTHGFGMMAAQTWMVPRQKYDVIHYIREAYFKPNNPSQYVLFDSGYIAALPKGDTRGPAPSNVEPWSNMNYGSYLTATYETPQRGALEKTNIAYKGIAVRLDSGPGGVAHGRHWMLFEHDTLRLSAAWSSLPRLGNANFIDWHGVNFDGRHAVHPHLVGTVQVSNPTGPGWANPATGTFADQRVLGRDGRRYGPLPRSWAKYCGLYQYGEQIVLSYTVGGTSVLELPGLVATQPDPTFTRTFAIGPRTHDLTMLVATPPTDNFAMQTIAMKDGQRDWLPIATLQKRSGEPRAKSREPARTGLPIATLQKRPENKDQELTNRVGGPSTLAVGVSGHANGALWKQGPHGSLLLHLPAGKDPLRFVLALRPLEAAKSIDRDALVDLATQPVTDARALTRGGPRRWPDVLTTTATVGPDDGPLAVDVLTPPDNNPWFCQMRLTGFDFFDDGDRAAVCAWDGDVWLVSGLAHHRNSPVNANAPRTFPLRWQRIASGLFQPLGLKIVEGQIFVTCRDQIVILSDFNGDGETDFYECFNSDHQVTEHFHEFAMGLQVDSAGNFYYAKSARHALPAVVPHHGTLLRVSKDGTRTEILANGFRAANGVCLNPDGSFVVTDQEGHWNPKNRINWVVPPRFGERPRFYGNMFGYHGVTDSSDKAMEPPLCWITNAFDRSPAELLWVTSDRWKPLTGSLLNLSYGYGKIYVVPHEKVGGIMQGGMCELPLKNFPTGIMRGRFHPKDGQLYVCGMFAWAGSVTQPGGFYRVRRTDKPLYVPAALHAKAKSLSITFTERLDRAAAADAANYQIKVWDLKRSADYGSKHHNERSLAVSAASLSDDGRTVTLQIPEIAPTWCMAIGYTLKGVGAEPLRGVVHNTIHRLAE